LAYVKKATMTMTTIQASFFSQKMAQKDPEKKMPSMAANAIMRSQSWQWR